MSARGSNDEDPFDRVFSISRFVRYVALYRDGVLDSHVRPGLSNASSSESDKYEELIVNPTLLTLVRQRGNIDCGGAAYVIVRYGNFFEYVQEIDGGHISSVGKETGADPIELAGGIQDVLRQTGLIFAGTSGRGAVPRGD